MSHPRTPHSRVFLYTSKYIHIFILRRMGKNKAQAPTLPRIRYVCFDLTHAPVATPARAAATVLVSMSTRPDPEGSRVLLYVSPSHPTQHRVFLSGPPSRSAQHSVFLYVSPSRSTQHTVFLRANAIFYVTRCQKNQACVIPVPGYQRFSKSHAARTKIAVPGFLCWPPVENASENTGKFGILE